MRTANIFHEEITGYYRVEYCEEGRKVQCQSFCLFEDARVSVDAWQHGKPDQLDKKSG